MTAICSGELAGRLRQARRAFSSSRTADGLLAAASVDQPELDALPLLEGRDAFGQRGSVDVHLVAAVVLGDEAEPLVGVEESHAPRRHVTHS
jgi:hypothetical protein